MSTKLSAYSVSFGHHNYKLKVGGWGDDDDDDDDGVIP